MYALIDSANKDLYQGDIIEDFPFINIATSKINPSDAGVTEVVDTQAQIRKIMLISQTCDAQRRENVIVCPIYNLDEYASVNQTNSDTLRNLRKRSIYYWFYLPAYEEIISESFVDFQQLIYYPRDLFVKFTDKRILTLDNLGRHRLSWALSTFFGRPL